MKTYGCYLSPVRGSLADYVELEAADDRQACRMAGDLLRANNEIGSAEVCEGDRRVCTVTDEWCAGTCSEENHVVDQARPPTREGRRARRGRARMSAARAPETFAV